MARWAQLALPLCVLVIGVALRVVDPPLLADARLKIFDQYQQLLPRRYVALPVRVVDLDDASLKRFGQWPWPRLLVARLVEALQRAGARSVVFNMVFAEPDRTSPAHLMTFWPSVRAVDRLRAQIGPLPDHDEMLARAIGGAKVVTGFLLTDGAPGPAPARKAGIAYAGNDPMIFLPRYSGAVANLSPIEAAAQGNGSLNVFADRDSIVRRVPLVAALGDEIYPTLAAEALRVAEGESDYLIKTSGARGNIAFGAQSGISHVKIGRFVVPTDRSGQLWLYHTGPVPGRNIAAWRVLSDSFDPKQVDGAIVFVGTSAAGLQGRWATPLHPAMAGVELQAQAVEQILAQDFLYRPDWADGAEIVALVVIGILVVYTVLRLGAAWGAALAVSCVAAAVFQSWQIFAQYKLLLAPLYPAIIIVLVYLSASVTSYLHSEAQRRQVRTAFGRYMPPVLLEQLARDPKRLRLGGEMRDMTLMFADVRDFTALSERLEADELTRLVNLFLTRMTEEIHACEGLVDKYMGDCIMAFWNAPLDDPDHARHACRAALAMRSGLADLNGQLRRQAQEGAQAHAALRIGIGINTGRCCVGNMGSEQRFDYSVLGDAVNLTARLEGLTKAYGVDALISGQTRSEAEGFATLELDRVRVKGKREPVDVFALLGDEQLVSSPAFRDQLEVHGAMISAYRRQDWASARDHLSRARRRAAGFGLEKVYDTYERRIAACERRPPGPHWDGVFVAETK